MKRIDTPGKRWKKLPVIVWCNFSIVSYDSSFKLYIFLVYRQQLQEQAKLLVEENALLMEQQEIQHKKMKEMQRIHGEEGWFKGAVARNAAKLGNYKTPVKLTLKEC